MPASFYALKVSEVRRETQDSVSVLFDVPKDLSKKFAFQPGQHLTIKQAFGNEEVRRNYSVCVSPQENSLRIAIKQIPQGIFSTWANTKLETGATLEVMPPHGSFTCKFEKDDQRQYVLFAGGSGITPILSILKTGLALEPQSAFTLLYGNRDSSSIMFLEELAALKNKYIGRLQLYDFLEDEEGEVELFNGRLDKEKTLEVLESVINTSQIDKFFICGPGPMMTAIEEALSKGGVPKNKVMVEHFTTGSLSQAQIDTAKTLQKQAAGNKVQISLEGRRRSFVFDSEKGSILENVSALGLPVPFACKAGVCATCRAKVISGKVEMKGNFGLTDEEVEQGYVLTCQAIPMSDNVELDYDA